MGLRKCSTRLSVVCLLIAVITLWRAERALCAVIESLDELELDENGRLKDHWLVYADGGCQVAVESAWKEVNGDSTGRKAVALSGKARSDMLGDVACGVAVLDRGLEAEFITTPFVPVFNYTRWRYSALIKWMNVNSRVEMGFLSYHANDISVDWINFETGDAVPIGVLEPGEPNTMWREARMGHLFRFTDVKTSENLFNFTAAYDSFNVVGSGSAPGSPPSQKEVRRDTAQLLTDAVHNAHRIVRTFTEMGFDKGRLPRALYGSMRTFYYNNRHSKAHEDWPKEERNVNWWVAPSYMTVAPFGLKGRWQTSLKPLVEEWIGGVKLENTDIYGIREYRRGARLLSHVDREETHAASLIINLDQVGVEEPWPLEIYDHMGHLHEVLMAPGDILYYESARCIHGRMRPFRGESFVNIFSHYRPVGEPHWYKRAGPDAAVAPRRSVGGAAREQLRHMSPSRARIKIEDEERPREAAKDLLDWWDYVGSDLSTDPLRYAGRKHAHKHLPYDSSGDL